MINIIPSIASGNQLNLAAELDRLEGINRLHLDVDDGNFIRGITFGIDTIKAIASYTSATLDAHLEVTNPECYIDDLCDCGVTFIAPHIEAMVYPSKVLGMIRARGKRPGLALNIKTSIHEVEPYIDQIDYVLVLSCETDYNGLKFVRPVLNKIKGLREMLPPEVSIWVDGGIGEKELREVAAAGADTVIMGRAIFRADSPEKEHRRLMNLVD
jgi:ribulose-phosphate 3-epimerase